MQVEKQGNDVDPVSFVNSLEVADIRSEYMLTLKDKLPDLYNNKTEGYVDAGSLVSFTDKPNAQNKADVLYSTLLAQLAANKKHDREGEPSNWYKEYINVLTNVGWVIQKDLPIFLKYDPKEMSFKMSDVVIDLLLSLVEDDDGGPLTDSAKKTLDALKKSSPDTIKLLASNSSSVHSGNFQILSCTVDPSGKDILFLLAFYFVASKVDLNYLFFTYEDSQIKLSKSAGVFALDEEVYGKVRAAIIQKLGVKTHSLVKVLSIE